MAKRKIQELTVIDCLKSLREMCEYFIKTKDYDYFEELFSIQVEELIEKFPKSVSDIKFQKEIEFYTKYSGLSEDNFLDKFSVSPKLSEDYDDFEDYNSSDWIDEKKFHKEFSKEFKNISQNFDY